MEIIEEKYSWAAPLYERSESRYLVLHHAAAKNVTAGQIHACHIGNGWSGIAYHYYVRTDGSIYRGRPETKTGAHTQGYNQRSIGICFEGNFDEDTMNPAQLKAGRELIADIGRRYPGIRVCRHGDLCSTSCPGENFPFEALTAEKKQPPDSPMNGRRRPAGEPWSRDCSSATETGTSAGGTM